MSLNHFLYVDLSLRAHAEIFRFLIPLYFDVTSEASLTGLVPFGNGIHPPSLPVPSEQKNN